MREDRHFERMGNGEEMMRVQENGESKRMGKGKMGQGRMAEKKGEQKKW